jgi:hypothetical protein
VRRSSLAVTLMALVATVAISSPAAALVRVAYTAPPQYYEYAEGTVCPMAIQLTERDGHTMVSSYEGDSIVRTDISGSVTTEITSSLGALTFESLGTTTVTPNADGTWTMVQKGSGLAIVPRGDPEGPALVWFTGRVTSVGAWYEKTLTFEATSQVREGLAANVCDMLVAGIKTRHGA